MTTGKGGNKAKGETVMQPMPKPAVDSSKMTPAKIQKPQSITQCGCCGQTTCGCCPQAKPTTVAPEIKEPKPACPCAPACAKTPASSCMCPNTCGCCAAKPTHVTPEIKVPQNKCNCCHLDKCGCCKKPATVAPEEKKVHVAPEIVDKPKCPCVNQPKCACAAK